MGIVLHQIERSARRDKYPVSKGEPRIGIVTDTIVWTPRPPPGMVELPLGAVSLQRARSRYYGVACEIAFIKFAEKGR